MITLEAVGGRRADRRLSRGNRRAVCLSERHVEPHLVIGDMAAGQWADPFTRDPSTVRPVAITRQSAPAGTSGQLFCRLRLRSGSALPAPQAAERFLTLIVGRSHLDRRAPGNAPTASRFRAGRALPTARIAFRSSPICSTGNSRCCPQSRLTHPYHLHSDRRGLVVVPGRMQRRRPDYREPIRNRIPADMSASIALRAFVWRFSRKAWTIA